MRNFPQKTKTKLRIILLASIVLSVFILAASLLAAPEEILAPNFDSSTKTVTPSVDVELGSTVTYTLIAKNSGSDSGNMRLLDVLPSGLTYITASITSESDAVQSSFIQNSGGITWTGEISANGEVVITLQATVDADFDGSSINNVLQIQPLGTTISKSAILRIKGKGLLYLPFVGVAPIAPTMNAIEGATDGIYTISWTNNDPLSGLTYVLEESESAEFETASTIYQGTGTSFNITTAKNGGTYYYRVKARVASSTNGDSGWSNVASAEVNSFTADVTTLAAGTCTTLRWDYSNIKAAFIELGIGYGLNATDGVSSAQVCPAETTEYQIKITDNNDVVSTTKLTITVTDPGCKSNSDPIIREFSLSKTTFSGSDQVEVSWEMECGAGIELRIDYNDDGGINTTIPVQGKESRTFTVTDTTRFELKITRSSDNGGDSIKRSLTITEE